MTSNPDWKKKPTVDLEAIERARDAVIHAAAVVRNCDCEQGYITSMVECAEREYSQAEPCECLKRWKVCMEDFKRTVGGDYREHVTRAMHDFTREPSELVPWARDWKQKFAAAIGNEDAIREIRREL